MSQGKRKIEAALSAAMRLKQLGEPFHAEAVSSLCRSNSALIETCSRLTRDLAEARSMDSRRIERLRREWGLDSETSHAAVLAAKPESSDSEGGKG